MKRAFTLVELVTVIAIVVILSVILFPVFGGTRCNSRRSDCQSNQKQIGIAFSQYAQDLDGRLPMVASRSLGWADVVRPYATNWAVFDCPSTPANIPPAATDYFFNGRMARFPIGRTVLPAKTLLLGEGDDARPPCVEFRSFPVSALENKKSPAWRHVEEGANYLFVGGHVKWIKPEDFEERIKWNPRHTSP